jgi:hypothetical protein
VSYVSISVQTTAQGTQTFSRSTATKKDVDDARAFLDTLTPDAEAVTAADGGTGKASGEAPPA